MEFSGVEQKNIRSDPLLKHIETNAEDGKEKYELIQQNVGRFGTMRIFLTYSPHEVEFTRSVHSMVYIIEKLGHLNK
jgi:hypothetical protein